MDIPVAARIALPGGPFLAHLRRDAAFHGFVAVYALAGLLIGYAAGVPQKVLPLDVFVSAAKTLPLVAVLALAATGVWSLCSSTPLKSWRINIAKVFSPQAVAGALLFVNVCVFTVVFSSIKQMLTDVVPFFADPYLAEVDRLLHGQDPWRLTSAVMPVHLMPALEGLYLGCWGFTLLGSMLAALFVPALRQVRMQFVWTYLIMWALLGNVLAGATMSAGPIFYDNVTGDPRFADLLDYLARNSQQERIRGFLWRAYSGAQPGVVGAGISAFPSMHVASATLCVLLVAKAHRWLLWAGIAYCAVILFGSVHLGWHYAVDGYFSIAATVLIWKVVGWVLKTKAPTS